MKYSVINRATPQNLISRLKELYLQSFPKEERRDFADLITKAFDGTISAIVATSNDGNFAGFITLWNLGEFTYVEHFAIDDALRGNGIGSEMLDWVKQSATSPLILEIEIPEDEVTQRRKNFYLRAGFTAHVDLFYEQPPYSPELPKVRMLLLTSCAVPDTKVKEFIPLLHRKVYNQ